MLSSCIFRTLRDGLRALPVTLLSLLMLGAIVQSAHASEVNILSLIHISEPTRPY